MPTDEYCLLCGEKVKQVCPRCHNCIDCCDLITQYGEDCIEHYDKKDLEK